MGKFLIKFGPLALKGNPVFGLFTKGVWGFGWGHREVGLLASRGKDLPKLRLGFLTPRGRKACGGFLGTFAFKRFKVALPNLKERCCAGGDVEKRRKEPPRLGKGTPGNFSPFSHLLGFLKRLFKKGRIHILEAFFPRGKIPGEGLAYFGNLRGYTFGRKGFLRLGLG